MAALGFLGVPLQLNFFKTASPYSSTTRVLLALVVLAAPRPAAAASWVDSSAWQLWVMLLFVIIGTFLLTLVGIFMFLAMQKRKKRNTIQHLSGFNGIGGDEEEVGQGAGNRPAQSSSRTPKKSRTVPLGTGIGEMEPTIPKKMNAWSVGDNDDPVLASSTDENQGIALKRVVTLREPQRKSVSEEDGDLSRTPAMLNSPDVHEPCLNSGDSGKRGAGGGNRHSALYETIDELKLSYDSSQGNAKLGSSEKSSTSLELLKNVDLSMHNISRDAVTLVEEIGETDSGNLFKGAFHNTTNGSKETKYTNHVWVHVLKENAQSESVKSFLHEAQVMAQLSHPNVQRFVGVTTSVEPWRLIKEYAPYGNLLGIVKKSKEYNIRVTYFEQLHYGAQIAAGLTYLATRNLVHCDIALRNMFVAQFNEVKIGNFTYSNEYRNLSLFESLKRRGALPLKWFAPEVVTKGASSFSLASDVWSFGMLLWELASSGKKPFHNIPNTGLEGELLRGGRPASPPRCEYQFYEVMRSCWEQTPHLRPTPSTLFAQLSDLCATSREDNPQGIRNVAHYVMAKDSEAARFDGEGTGPRVKQLLDFSFGESEEDGNNALYSRVNKTRRDLPEDLYEEPQDSLARRNTPKGPPLPPRGSHVLVLDNSNVEFRPNDAQEAGLLSPFAPPRVDPGPSPTRPSVLASRPPATVPSDDEIIAPSRKSLLPKQDELPHASEVDASDPSYVAPQDMAAVWYHDDPSKKAVTQLLSEMGMADGLYLVRTSKTTPGEHMLVLCYASKPHNFRIKKAADGTYSIDGVESFVSLTALVRHYSLTGNERLPVRLSIPCPCKGKIKPPLPASQHDTADEDAYDPMASFFPVSTPSKKSYPLTAL